MLDETKDLNNEEQKDTSDVAKEENKERENEPNVDELVTQLAQERAQRAKEKNALDKALKEVGELKKSLRARQTAEEQEEEAKREQMEAHEAYVKELESYKAINEAKIRYLAQGMDAETASLCADAEIKGDYDELVSLQKKHTDELLKAKEAEWLKSRPEPNVGSGEAENDDAFLKGFNSIPSRFSK